MFMLCIQIYSRFAKHFFFQELVSGLKKLKSRFLQVEIIYEIKRMKTRLIT